MAISPGPVSELRLKARGVFPPFKSFFTVPELAVCNEICSSSLQLKESFLHYVWQHQCFSTEALASVSGEPLTVLHPGLYNLDSGPDFLHARILIAGVEWAGSVEIHLRSSDYVRHRHGEDPAYDPVILHVVWREDQSIMHKDGTAIPALELGERVDPDLLRRYRMLAESSLQLPCHRSVAGVPFTFRDEMIRTALVHRLDQQASRVLAIRQGCNGDWNETFYRLLARAFGLRVNAEAFSRLAELLPLRLLLKYADRPQTLEALLFGTAGFLSGLPEDSYQLALLRIYGHLRTMYGLNQMNRSEWKFMRMRPAGFPTLRLARFSSIVPGLNGLLSDLLKAGGPDRFRTLMMSRPSPYWENHLKFGKPLEGNGLKPGDRSADIMVINTLVPFLAAWAKFTGDFHHLNVAIDLLESMPAEEHQSVNVWLRAGWKPSNAAGSQAMNWQLRERCRLRKCLDCSVGQAILRGNGAMGLPD